MQNDNPTQSSSPGQNSTAESGKDNDYSSRQQPKSPRRSRSDKQQLHTTRHGVLSKYPLEALARFGENVRRLRQIERILRVQLQPRGILAELLFDRVWPSFLRTLLMVRTEAALWGTENQSETADGPPTLRDADLPTLVYEQSAALDKVPVELLRYLGILQRYDAHFCKEFYRGIGMLLALKNGGEISLHKCS